MTHCQQLCSIVLVAGMAAVCVIREWIWRCCQDILPGDIHSIITVRIAPKDHAVVVVYNMLHCIIFAEQVKKYYWWDVKTKSRPR